MNYFVKLFFVCSVFVVSLLNSFSQNQNFGEVHGNFETTAQYYNPDSAIGAPPVPEKMLMNGFANINYTYGNSFSAGIRYENYLNALQGFPIGYKGTGIPFRYATYKNNGLEITAGNYYEQFGSGMILRAYEERGLGYDNVFDGMRMKYSPYKGILLKGLIGKQRLFFSQSAGIVRGIDGEIQLNELFSKWNETKTRINVGGSFVSKYEKDDNVDYILPENVGSSAVRINLIRGGFTFGTEYVSKINDPSVLNNYIYKNGQGLLLTTSYAQKGFAINLTAKRVDNMNFRSERTATINNLLINYIPAMTKQHTYLLMAFYPYASQPNGEMTYQAEGTYKFKKGTKLGGLYGTEVLLNYSQANGIVKVNSNDSLTTRKGYTSDFLKFGNKYFSDVVLEVNRKFSKKMKSTFSFSRQFYDKDVIQGDGVADVYDTIVSNIFVLDCTYKIKTDKAIRAELQHLGTKQDQQNWALGLVEYTHGEHWFFAIVDQYNYNNNDDKKRFHYVSSSVGYIKDANRITISYGKQRAGIFCVGGVCRTVPASNGLSVSITSSF